MKYLACVLIGYLIGSVNPSYIIAKLRGFDIRRKGSGNAGASNALILFGKSIGILCAIFDIAKATLAILLASALFGELYLILPVTGVACILGHIFPFYMKFNGGKGLACLGGLILAYDWRIFLIMLAGEIVIALMTNYICFVPITASIILPIAYGILEENLPGALILCISTVVILLRHRENLRRIKNGTEMHLSFLWNKEKETARILSKHENADFSPTPTEDKE